MSFKRYFNQQNGIRLLSIVMIAFLFSSSLLIIGSHLFVSENEDSLSTEYTYSEEGPEPPFSYQEDDSDTLDELFSSMEDASAQGESTFSQEDLLPSYPAYETVEIVEVVEAIYLQYEPTPPWLEPNFMPHTDELDEILGRHGYQISVFYKNLDSGFIYRHNADRVYFAASVTKAFYALYLFQLAEQGILCLDTEHTFTGADFKDGSGIIRERYPIGSSFTLRELLRLNVSYSDNIATLILVREHGAEGFRHFLTELGGNLDQMGWGIMDFNMSAEEAGIFLYEVYQYIEEGGEYALSLKSDLLDNQYPFIVSDYPVASKTGWTSFQAWHDAAIVYAPSPYILVIFTARGGWTETDFQDFAEISMAFQKFNSQWFEP